MGRNQHAAMGNSCVCGGLLKMQLTSVVLLLLEMKKHRESSSAYLLNSLTPGNLLGLVFFPPPGSKGFEIKPHCSQRQRRSSGVMRV